MEQPTDNPAPALEREALGLPAIRPVEWLWLAVCTVLGGALRLINLAGRPLWADELTTIITAGRPLGESFTTEQDPQPPLYQLLVRLFSGNIAGGDPAALTAPGAGLPSETILRMPAALFGTLTIAAAWWCARHFVGRVGAALIAILVAVNPLLVHHARDARPYALFVFFACLAVGFGYRLARTGRARDIVGYALATAGMFLSHYYAMFFVAAQLAFFAADFLMGGSTRRHLWRVLAGLVLAFILSLPPLLLFARLITGGMKGSWWIAPPTGLIHGFDALGDMLGLRALGILCAIPLLAAFWLPKAAILRSERGALWGAWWLGRERAVYLALFIVFALFLPVIVSLLLKPAWVERYSLPVVIPMLILGLAYLRSAGPGVTVLVLAILLAAGLHKSRSEAAGEPGLRDAVAVIQQHQQPGDAVFLPDWRFAPDFVHPEAVGLRYYGYNGPYETTEIEHFYAFLSGSAKLTDAQVAHIKANPGQLLPPGRTWAVCFLSTAKPLREFLIQQRRSFREWTFGQYSDRSPMYTLLRIDPAAP